MPAAVPFISGKDAVLRLFVNGSEVILNLKRWRVQPDVTKAADGVNGEDRDRLQSFVNFYSMDTSGYIDKGTQIDSLLQYIANNDAEVAPFDAAVGMKLRCLDGSKKAYVGKEVALDDFTIDQTDRKERVMFQLNARFRYFDPTSTL